MTVACGVVVVVGSDMGVAVGACMVFTLAVD